MTRRLLPHGIVIAALLLLALWPAGVAAECEPEPVTPDTPTGIAGCERWGSGTASEYGPGTGVAMNFCTWEIRHSTGCGWVAIQSNDTGIVVTVPVVDFCDCWTGTKYERIVDLQYSVVDALGLDRARGLYDVTVWREGASSGTLPNTAMRYTTVTGDETVNIESRTARRSAHPTRWAVARLYGG